MIKKYERLHSLLVELENEGIHPFIGYGNPDADILIVGKECALKEDSSDWKKFYEKNFHQWKVSFGERGFSYKTGEEDKDYNFEDGYFHPIFPFYPQLNSIKSSSTYYYYQRLYERIYKIEKSVFFNFFENCFITELNEHCRPNNYKLDKSLRTETEKNIRERFDWMRRTNFFNKFRIVVLACGPYAKAIKKDEMLKKELFGNAHVYFCNQLSQWRKKMDDIIIPDIISHIH